MKKRAFLSMLMLLAIFTFQGNLFSQSVEDEISGTGDRQPNTEIRGGGRNLTGGIPAGGLLLVPESGSRKVMAFDPVTGDLIDADFIPSDLTNLSTPIEAILSASGKSILVSDQIDDVVQEYALDGTYIGVFAPAGGVNNAIMDNIRGITLRPNGNLLVTVGDGVNAGDVVEFDTEGIYIGVFYDGATGGTTGPFDVAPRPGQDYLLSEIDADKIVRIGLNGNYLADFAPVITFPEQMHITKSGNILVANFSGIQEGIVEFTSTGSLVGVYNPVPSGGYRGIYELPNGNILTTNGTGVYEVDRMENIVSTKISGVSARFITYIPGPETNPSQIPLSPYMILLAAALIVLVTYFRFRKY